MKIALLYSGTIRNLPETIGSNLEWFNFADEIDLYFSVWNHVGYVDRINAPDYVRASRTLDPALVVTEDLIKSLVPKSKVPKSKVKIKKIKIEKYDAANYRLDLINGTDNPGLHAQYYKIWDCFTLLDPNIKYDSLARMRCDVLYSNKITKQDAYDAAINNKILFNEKIWHNYPRREDSSAINEMIWISNKTLMKKACSIYNNGHKINKIISKNSYDKPNYGESITYMNLQAEGLSNHIKLFDFNYTVLR